MNDAAFGPVDRLPRLSDTISEKLLESIVSETFAPGDVLPSERDLALQFGVSRTVVREAVRSLSAKGVVRVRAGRGVEVLQLGTSAVSEALSLLFRLTNDGGFAQVQEVRMMLETHLAGVAAERAEEHEIARLIELIELMEGPADDKLGTVKGTRAAADLDVAFHRAIASAAHNDLYLVLLDALYEVQGDMRRIILSVVKDPYFFLDDHRSMARAIADHDAEAARSLMQNHLARVSAIWHRPVTTPEVPVA